jgi:hypothetical protein
MPILIIIGALLVGPAVAAAVAELLHVLLIAAVVLAVVAGAGLVALGAWQLRHRDAEPTRPVYRATPVATPHVRALPEPRPAIERAAEVHLHFHGVSAEEAAAAIRQARGEARD